MIHNPLNPIWIEYVWQMMPIGSRNAANIRAVQTGNFFASDDDSKTWDNALGIRPDNPGNGPATHLIVGYLARQSQVDDLPQSKIDLPGSNYWRESEGWTYGSVLADSAMQEIPSDPI